MKESSKDRQNRLRRERRFREQRKFTYRAREDAKKVKINERESIGAVVQDILNTLAKPSTVPILSVYRHLGSFQREHPEEENQY